MRIALRVAFGAVLLCLLALASAKLGADTPVQEKLVTLTADSTTQTNKPVADNSRCFVCHGNYDFDDEKLASVHAKANIGCVRCHGDSPKHSADEDGLTPPERMYAQSRIRFNCLGGHDWVKLVASDRTKQNRADLKDKPNHQAALDGTIKDKKFCTDCHGEHRLGHRTRRWNKRTGELVYRDSTPKMLIDSSSSQ